MNTDKYEGHTVGDMTFSQAGEKLWFLEHPHSHNASDCMTMNKATLDLIADAPLLLAEVERLRDAIERAIAYKVDDNALIVLCKALGKQLNPTRGEGE